MCLFCFVLFEWLVIMGHMWLIYPYFSWLRPCLGGNLILTQYESVNLKDRVKSICTNHNKTATKDEHCAYMMTSSNGNFSALLALCAGNSPVTGEFPSQRPVTRSFDVSLICALNKRLSKQSWDWLYETPSRSLWRHYNGFLRCHTLPVIHTWATRL